MTTTRFATDQRDEIAAPLAHHPLTGPLDEAGIRDLVRQLNPRLFRIARGILDNDADAEEVVQEAYLSAFTHLQDFRGEASFTTWISRIAINAARMHLRRHHNEAEYDTVAENPALHSAVIPFPRPGTTGEAMTMRHEARVLLEDAVTRLPPDLRLPFLLFEVEGQDLRSIARDLDINPATLRTRLFRARRRLRKMLEAEFEGGFDAIFPFAGTRCTHMADNVVTALKARQQPGPDR